jgi:hypothetical protein
MKHGWFGQTLRAGIGALALTVLVVLAACRAAQAPASAPMAEPAFDRAAPSTGGAVAQLSAEDGAAAADRKVIARAQLDLLVTDAGATAAAITELVARTGGYVTASNLYRTSYAAASNVLQGSMTVRVPADRLEETLAALEQLAVQVTSRSLNREDVTDQYSDVDSRLRNLEATETELRAMLTEVRQRPGSTTEDIMAVYRTLTDVRGEIEQLRGRKNVFDNLIALSTIEVRLLPDVAELPLGETGWRPAAVMRSAQRALVGALQTLVDVAIWGVIFVLPVAVVTLLPVMVVGRLLRTWLRRTGKRRTDAAGTPAA